MGGTGRLKLRKIRVPRDRLSELPDEIIHGVMARLNSPTQAARVTILSKRWIHLWASYPILEFNDRELTRRSRESEAVMNEFWAVAKKKLAGGQSCLDIEAIRIGFTEILYHISAGNEFLHDVLLLMASTSSRRARQPREVFLNSNDFAYPDFAAPLIINRGLRSLTIKRGHFENIPAVDLEMPNLRVLHLSRCTVFESWVNSLIAGVPMLETLVLKHLWPCCSFERGFGALEIRNHRNLKSLEIEDCLFEEIRIDAPKLVSFCFEEPEARRVVPSLFTFATNFEAAAEVRFAAYFNDSMVPFPSQEFIDLKDLLAHLSKLFGMIRFCFAYGLRESRRVFVDLDRIQDDSFPPVVVDRVDLSTRLVELDKMEAFFDALFWSCHPCNLLLAIEPYKGDNYSFLKSVWCLFMEYNHHLECPRSSCKCWRHRLKAVGKMNC